MQKIIKKLATLKEKSIVLQKDQKVSFNKTKYSFAALDQLQDKLEEPLAELQLLITHQVVDESLTTTIRDLESEDKIQSSIPLSTQKAQDKGSEITYYRRYNLLSLLDLKTEDDDGQQAQKSKKMFEPNTKAREQATQKKVPLTKIKEHYSITEKNESLYLEAIK